MSSELRREVLMTFKKLHRARLIAFQGDDRALKLVRQKINDEYRKYKNVSNTDAVKELNKFAGEVEHEVRTSVIQAVERKPGVYQLNVRKDHLFDSVPPPGTPLPKPERRCGTSKTKPV